VAAGPRIAEMRGSAPRPHLPSFGCTMSDALGLRWPILMVQGCECFESPCACRQAGPMGVRSGCAWRRPTPICVFMWDAQTETCSQLTGTPGVCGAGTGWLAVSVCCMLYAGLVGGGVHLHSSLVVPSSMLILGETYKPTHLSGGDREECICRCLRLKSGAMPGGRAAQTRILFKRASGRSTAQGTTPGTLRPHSAPYKVSYIICMPYACIYP